MCLKAAPIGVSCRISEIDHACISSVLEVVIVGVRCNAAKRLALLFGRMLADSAATVLVTELTLHPCDS